MAAAAAGYSRCFPVTVGSSKLLGRGLLLARASASERKYSSNCSSKPRPQERWHTTAPLPSVSVDKQRAQMPWGRPHYHTSKTRTKETSFGPRPATSRRTKRAHFPSKDAPLSAALHEGSTGLPRRVTRRCGGPRPTRSAQDRRLPKLERPACARSALVSLQAQPTRCWRRSAPRQQPMNARRCAAARRACSR